MKPHSRKLKKKDYKIHRTTQWNLDLTRPSVYRTSLCNPVIVKYMEKYLDTTERRYSEHILQVP